MYSESTSPCTVGSGPSVTVQRDPVEALSNSYEQQVDIVRTAKPRCPGSTLRKSKNFVRASTKGYVRASIDVCSVQNGRVKTIFCGKVACATHPNFFRGSRDELFFHKAQLWQRQFWITALINRSYQVHTEKNDFFPAKYLKIFLVGTELMVSTSVILTKLQLCSDCAQIKIYRDIYSYTVEE